MSDITPDVQTPAPAEVEPLYARIRSWKIDKQGRSVYKLEEINSRHRFTVGFITKADAQGHIVEDYAAGGSVFLPPLDVPATEIWPYWLMIEAAVAAAHRMRYGLTFFHADLVPAPAIPEEAASPEPASTFDMGHYRYKLVDGYNGVPHYFRTLEGVGAEYQALHGNAMVFERVSSRAWRRVHEATRLSSAQHPPSQDIAHAG